MRLVTAAAICLSVTGLSFAANGWAAITRPTHVDAQGLGPALEVLAKEHGFQLLYRAQIVAGLRAAPLDGDLTTGEALGRLLGGSGLTYRYLGENAVTIVPLQLRMAQEEQGDAASIPVPPREPEHSSQQSPVELEQVTVTGSRLLAVDGDGPRQVNTYSSEQIRASGQTTVTDFLNTLPEVSTQSSEMGTQMFVGQTTVQLRGLPIGTTLILLDGRRLEGGGVAGAGAYGTTFNLNNIPVAAIDRIEVVPEGSSATYGSDALAGVVNIILKKDFEGAELNLRYGGATGVRDTSADLAWGITGDRGAVTAVATYQNRGDLPGSARVITSTSDYRYLGGPDLSSKNCNPGNVFSVDGTNLPGLSTPQAGIPAGITGLPSVAAFAGSNGTLNKCGHESESSLIPSDQTAGGLLSAHYDLLPEVQLFAELMYSHQEQRDDLGPQTLPGQLVPAKNAFNPFGEDVLVSYRFPQQYQLTHELRTDFVRPLLGAKGTIGHGWTWEASAWFSRDRTRVIEGNLGYNGVAISDALASSDPATALNLFSANSPASSSLIHTMFPDDSGATEGRAYTAQSFVRGSLWHLPAGDVDVVLGGEYDDESLLGKFSGNYNYDYTRSSYAAFAETRIPLLSSDRLGHVTTTFASRYDHAEGFGGKSTSQAGLEWRPLSSLLLRGSWAQAYRAPPLYYVDSMAFAIPYQLADPKNGNQIVTVPTTLGGNKSLLSETGSSRSAGVVWTPQSIDALRTSVTWWQVLQHNRIAALQAQEILDNEALFPDRVSRAPSVNGQAGAIQSIDWSYINFGELKVAGVDTSASYKIHTPVGIWTPSINVDYIQRYDAAILPGAPTTNRVSMASEDAWAPRWKGTTSIAWQRDVWSTAISGRYVSRYTDYDGVRTLGDLWFCDVNAQYEIGRQLLPLHKGLAHTKLSVGAVNVFDALPRSYSSYNGGTYGFDPAQDDVRGRYVYASVSVGW